MKTTTTNLVNSKTGASVTFARTGRAVTMTNSLGETVQMTLTESRQRAVALLGDEGRRLGWTLVTR